MRGRRLDFGWLSRTDRRWARIGVAGTAAAGAGVIAAGLGEPRTVVTVSGIQPVVTDWVLFVAHLGPALAAIVLFRGEKVRSASRISVGFILTVMAVGQIEGALRPLEASMDSLGAGFVVARILAWVALACGFVLMIGGRSSVATRLTAIAVGGFVLLLLSHLVALWSAAGIAPDTLRAASTNGLWFAVDRLSWWLLLFAIWQLAEGLHGAVDGGRALSTRLGTGWMPWIVATKIVLLIVGFAVLSPVEFEEWQTARSAAPLGWAYAVVVAMALVTWLRAPVGPRFDRASVFRAGVVVIGVWEAPFIGAFLLVVAAFLAQLAIPSSSGDLFSLGMVTVLAMAGRAWVQGRGTRWWVAALSGLALVGAIVAPQASTSWSRQAEASVVSWLGDVADWLASSALTWQAWALVLLPFAALIWIAFGRRVPAVAGALLVVGVWVMPRALSVLLVNVLDVAPFVAFAPNLLMLDVAVTLAAAWVLVADWRRGGLGDTSRAMGLVVVVVTVVTHGSELAGAIAGYLGDAAASLVSVDAEALVFVVLLVLPAVYSAAFNAQAVNAIRSEELLFIRIGASCVLFAVAVVLISAGTMTPENLEDELFRVLALPGLTIVAVMTVLAPGPAAIDRR